MTSELQDQKLQIQNPQIYGTWRLVAATAVDVNDRPIRDPYGPIPMGRIVLNEAGRMMVVVCDGRLSIPDGQKRGHQFYSGNYRIEGDRLITDVDVAIMAERIGGQQIRKFKFRDGDLVLYPPRRSDGEQRELVWRLDGPA
jgi:hypothetical protein